MFMPKYVSMEQLIAEVQKYPGEYRYSSIPKWAIEELINGGYRLDEMRVLIDAGEPLFHVESIHLKS